MIKMVGRLFAAMKTTLATGLLFAATMFGADSNAVALAKHCIVNTPREGIRYAPFPAVFASGMKSCRAYYPLKDGSTLGLSVLVPMKNGQAEYESPYASMIVSVTQKGAMTMYTDEGIDGLLDRVTQTGGTQSDVAGMTEKQLQRRFNDIVKQWLDKYK